MQASITDVSALTALTPLQISAYLSARGAVVRGKYKNKASIWSYGDDQILLPLSKGIGGYAEAISNILTTIAEKEERSQLQIYKDVQISGFDVIRVRNDSEETKTGTLNLMGSVDFVAAARDMLLAAACSASSHKLRYASRKPQEALDYMETVKLGQTEYGSFVITLLSPVSPVFKQQNCLIEMEEDLPYEKKVVPTLNSGLLTLDKAAQSVIESGDASLLWMGRSRAFLQTYAMRLFHCRRSQSQVLWRSMFHCPHIV